MHQHRRQVAMEQISAARGVNPCFDAHVAPSLLGRLMNDEMNTLREAIRIEGKQRRQVLDVIVIACQMLLIRQ